MYEHHVSDNTRIVLDHASWTTAVLTERRCWLVTGRACTSTRGCNRATDTACVGDALTLDLTVPSSFVNPDGQFHRL